MKEFKVVEISELPEDVRERTRTDWPGVFRALEEHKAVEFTFDTYRKAMTQRTNLKFQFNCRGYADTADYWPLCSVRRTSGGFTLFAYGKGKKEGNTHTFNS